MKRTALSFVFFICFVSANGFCQNSDNAAGRNRTPLTWEIVRALSNSDEDIYKLGYYLSQSVSLKVEQSSTGGISIKDEAIEFSGKNQSENNAYSISDNEKGRLHNNLGEILEVTFKDSVTLRFRRNTGQNRFDLVSAVIDAKNFVIQSNAEIPFLIVLANNANDFAGSVEVRAVPISTAGGNAQTGYIQQRTSQFSVPLIDRFEVGKYYVQLGAYRNAGLAQAEITKIGGRFPVKIMKATVNIRGRNTLVHRILIGPLDYNESCSLLQRFKAIYHDAFVWLGR